jgi:hypothetical protein
VKNGSWHTLFHLHERRIDVEGNKTKTLCKDFIHDNGGVIPYIDILNAHSWNLKTT